ncbi:alpha/beta fold hydrolase [Rufibacter glacialis]|uniref:Alpha/beta fold hydrolase n=1 Tax=Rufibacter glacialis TaxID=1259555 RepID=A0A5M8Q777_9BACT|nr:alpha/beta hydrolase [Rufibacter glacialis]KAA6430736.1 alpha/beta hydrolase [Rufibacter glacialis]GGK86337.1 AB hydrolase superfamily protein YfhM [Rufibacter glacialis]
METREKYYRTNGMELHTVEAGSPTGKVILFLHGFPEFWYGWRKQLAFFAEKGFRAVAPDQRGYGLSSKPQGVKAYTIDQITQDIVDLIPQITQEKVVLVGHDWGGGVAWNLALHFPDLLEKLVILNMPHPAVIHDHLRHNPRQMLRSWYAFFFQVPWAPEALNSAFHFKLLETIMTRSALPGTFSPQDMAAYKAAWAQPGALEKMINWYRAYKYNPVKASHPVETPTLLLWGKQDTFLGSELALPSMGQCRQGQLVFLEEATHWLHHEQPEKVNGLIYDFLQ